MTTQVLSTRLQFRRTDSGSTRPTLSVVVPLFNEEESIPELIRRLRHATETDTELIFVNDGSDDRTAVMLDELSQSDARITVIHFSRNFGHQPAISAGLARATGRAIAILDGDLQDPPELLPRMLAEWRAGAEVVYGVRRRRKANPFKRIAYASYYRLLRAASDITIPLDAGDFGLMDRSVVEAMLALPERSRFVRGLRAYVGFRQVALEYDRPDREAGESKYPIGKLIRLAIDGLFDFSSLPIRLISWTAGILLLTSLTLTVMALLSTSVMMGLFAALFGIGGVITGSLSVIGEYVRKVFVEVKGRPGYVIRSVSSAESLTMGIKPSENAAA